MRNINTYILCLLALSDICYISELGNLSKEKFGKLVKFKKEVPFKYQPRRNGIIYKLAICK